METKSSRGKWFLIILLGAVGVGVYTYKFKNRGELNLTDRAEHKAAIIAQQLIEHQFEVKTFLPEEKNTPQESAEAGRGLASQGEVFAMTHKVLDGEVGRDPWGNPYGFFVKGDGKKGSTIYIWSMGANEKADFKVSTDFVSKGATGDDILVVVPF